MLAVSAAAAMADAQPIAGLDDRNASGRGITSARAVGRIADPIEAELLSLPGKYMACRAMHYAKKEDSDEWLDAMCDDLWAIRDRAHDLKATTLAGLAAKAHVAELDNDRSFADVPIAVSIMRDLLTIAGITEPILDPYEGGAGKSWWHNQDHPWSLDM